MRLALFVLAVASTAAEYKDGYADSNGVKIHYVTTGAGPLVVMIHGFPDFWYTWRHQMDALSSQYQVAALDLRGYNLSDKPTGEENYDMRLLIGDVAAVVKSLGREKAIIVGHDWGGAIAWQFTFNMPQMVEKLIILNLPHPNGLSRELATNEKQKANSAYARRFQHPESHKALTAEGLAGWVKDPAAKEKYIEAFKRSDFNSMMSYYRRNYPKEPYEARITPQRVKVPVLMIHGLNDTALLSPALNNTWDWLDADLTLVTIPNAGHFVQQDAAELVSKSIKSWLNR
ncbi:MAG: alpha/beta fold hydrolase [Bryobacteraceae bacterium]